MAVTKSSDATPNKNRTTLERTSDRELLVTRTVNGPPRLVFQAWSNAELFQQWWVPRSFGITLLSCETDVRVGGRYRLVVSHPSSPTPMEFFGRYVAVQAPSRIAWTNEEAGEAGPVTTVTFEEQDGNTRLTMHELYPSKEALDAAMASGEKSGTEETFEQLEQLLITLKSDSSATTASAHLPPSS